MSERSSSCSFLEALPSKLVVPLLLLGGIAIGLLLYNIQVSRAFSYLSDDPAACVNCHVMGPSYQSWSKSSHANWATCNDCHVPQHNALAGFLSKAQDGLRHAAVSLTNNEPAAPRPADSSIRTIQSNCVRCHTTLNTEFVKTSRAEHRDILNHTDKACFDCHRHVPHTKNSGLASAPHANVPYPPASPMPAWLKNIMR